MYVAALLPYCLRHYNKGWSRETWKTFTTWVRTKLHWD